MATRCSPPTRISLNKSIQIPGQSALLTWSGATPGSGTAIRGYAVYRATSQSGTYSLLINTSSTSCSVAAPDSLARGTFYYYKIVTKGTVPETDSLVENSPVVSLKANTLPSAPTVKQDKAKLPSNTDSNHPATIKFEVTPGSDSDGQSLSLAYSLNSDTTKTRFTSPLSLSFTEATTVKFYTFDGLEYGAITLKDIVKNEAPTIAFDTITKTTYNALGGNGISGKQKGYVSAISPCIDTNKGGTVTLGIEYYYSKGTEAFTTSGTGYGYKTMKQIVLTPSDMGTVNRPLGDFNIHDFIPQVTSTNLHWRIYARLNDGIETTDWIYYPSQSSEEYYSIAHTPEVINKYNQFSNSDINGTNSGEIWKNVRFKFYNDESVTNIRNVYAKITSGTSAQNLENSYTTSVVGDFRYVDITLPDNIPGEAKIDIEIALVDNNISITKTVKDYVFETKTPSFSNFSYVNTTIKPFTQTGTFTISIAWPFGSSASFSAALAAYNCNTNASGVKLVFSSSGLGDGANRDARTFSASNWSKVGDALTTSMAVADVYGWDNALGITTYSGEQTYYCRLEITNLFGKTYSDIWSENKFNFNELPVRASIEGIQWSSDQTNWHDLDLQHDKIQKGMYLKFDCEFELYTTDDITVSMLLEDYLPKRSIGCIDNLYTPPSVTYTVHISSGFLYLRETPNTQSATTGYLQRNSTFTSSVVVEGEDVNGVNTWVYYDNGQVSGYASGRYLNPTPKMTETPITYPRNHINYAIGRSPALNERSYIYHITEDIVSIGDRQWSIQITNSSGSLESTQVYTLVIRQTAPDLSLVECIVDKNYDIHYTYTMSDDGVGNISSSSYSITHYFYDGTNEITSAIGDTTTGVITIDPNYQGWEVKTISVKTVSVVTETMSGGNTYTNTGTYYSNALLVYRTAPTVAYRKNQIGINTDEPNSGTTVDIYQATGKPEIRINGVTNPALIPTQFRINATTGQIGFYLYDSQTDTYILQHILDLMNGTLT